MIRPASRISRTAAGQRDDQDGQAAAGNWQGCGFGLAALCLAAALIRGSAFGGYPGLVCVAYIPAAAVIILAAMLRMLADLPGRCCWPAAGQWDDQDG